MTILPTYFKLKHMPVKILSFPHFCRHQSLSRPRVWSYKCVILRVFLRSNLETNRVALTFLLRSDTGTTQYFPLCTAWPWRRHADCQIRRQWSWWDWNYFLHFSQCTAWWWLTVHCMVVTGSVSGDNDRIGNINSPHQPQPRIDPDRDGDGSIVLLKIGNKSWNVGSSDICCLFVMFWF